MPEELRKELEKVKRLEWITIAYLVSVVILMYLVLGSSQAMKTAWLEDVLSLIPAMVFLIASKINNRSASREFPYGYHRVFSISFLTGAVALFGMGLFLIFDSSMALIKAERPTIGSIQIFGQQLWMGWLMILALLYSAIPAMILGRLKLPKAGKLHNKVLHTDASAQKADYMTAFAAILGVLGIGFGLWWADAVAALFISFSILKDGYINVKSAILDLMDQRPKTVEKEEEDPLIQEVEDTVNSWEWVKEAKVRFREHGQIYFGEIAVVPERLDLQEITRGYEIIRKKHWKLYDFSIVVVEELPKWD